MWCQREIKMLSLPATVWTSIQTHSHEAASTTQSLDPMNGNLPHGWTTVTLQLNRFHTHPLQPHQGSKYLSLTVVSPCVNGSLRMYFKVWSIFLSAGLLIAVNYISVIVFFPCVIIIYHLYFEKYKCCCCCPREKADDLEICCPREKPDLETPETTTTQSKVKKPKKTRSNILVQFFHGPYYRYKNFTLVNLLCVKTGYNFEWQWPTVTVMNSMFLRYICYDFFSLVRVILFTRWGSLESSDHERYSWKPEKLYVKDTFGFKWYVKCQWLCHLFWFQINNT